MLTDKELDTLLAAARPIAEALCRRKIRNPEDRKEVVQDLLASLCAKRENPLEWMRKPLEWDRVLTRAADNAINSYLRKHYPIQDNETSYQANLTILLSLRDENPSPLDCACRQDFRRIISSASKKLTSQQQHNDYNMLDNILYNIHYNHVDNQLMIK